jgi:hypothetical protein
MVGGAVGSPKGRNTLDERRSIRASGERFTIGSSLTDSRPPAELCATSSEAPEMIQDRWRHR